MSVAPARTASLTHLRLWPGDGFFGQKSEVGIPTSVEERSRNSDLGGRIPTLAQARQAGGFYAGQVARQGFYAGPLLTHLGLM